MRVLSIQQDLSVTAPSAGAAGFVLLNSAQIPLNFVFSRIIGASFAVHAVVAASNNNYVITQYANLQIYGKTISGRLINITTPGSGAIYGVINVSGNNPFVNGLCIDAPQTTNLFCVCRLSKAGLPFVPAVGDVITLLISVFYE